MLTISKDASVKRANPVRTYPSTTSITPLIKGTPGTRYSTLVASAISEVVSNIKAVDAHRAVSYTHLTLPTTSRV